MDAYNTYITYTYNIHTYIYITYIMKYVYYNIFYVYQLRGKSDKYLQINMRKVKYV